MTSSVPKLDVALLKSYLDLCNDKSLPASVLMEAIVHFREHPKVIREIIWFQRNKGFKMLKAWLERGQKLRKNDILDMLCVGVLDKVHVNTELSVLIDQMAYLISFDETMMQFICNNVENAKLINRFLLHS